MNTVPIVDVRAERPEPPPEFSDAEKALWRHLVESRRPGWFAGSESLLQSFITTTVHCQAIEQQLRKTTPRATAKYERLARLHRAAVSQCASLARLLRLAVNARIDKRQRHDGDAPIGDVGFAGGLHVVPGDDDLRNPSTGERDFALLRQRMLGANSATNSFSSSSPQAAQSSGATSTNSEPNLDESSDR